MPNFSGIAQKATAAELTDKVALSVTGGAKYVPASEILALATAEMAAYDNAVSGLTATTVQEAIDELAAGGGGGASIGVQYTADTGSTADSDPGPGLLKWNNATQGSATVLFLDDDTSDGVSLAGWWSALDSGGFCYLQHATDQDTWQIWEIGTITDATGYVKLAVTLLADGGSFADGDPMLVTLQQGVSAGSAAWGSITGTIASQTDLQAALDAKAAVGIPQNSQSTAYTLVLADANKHIYHPSADTTARIWTIPANSSVAFPIGTAVTFVNDTSGGVITIAITTDTLVLAGAGTTGSRSLAANGVATAIKITSTRWQINGTGLT
jgi:hypothetical protein